MTGENVYGAHFLQRCRKNEYGDPHFLSENTLYFLNGETYAEVNN